MSSGKHSPGHNKVEGWFVLLEHGLHEVLEGL